MPPAFPYRNALRMPVIGLEAEFKVFIDEEAIVPEEYWRAPKAFIDRPLLRRGTKASQLPTGGAVYFDGGVLEVVTPVIEIAPQCTARVVRSLWEQIGFIRDQLDRWETRNAKTARLQAFSCHYNVSFELDRSERHRDRTIQKLALLLMHLLSVPAIITSANSASTGFGVRPRRDRIEITLDFTPDPGLMAATAALIVGIAREVITWPSYRLEELSARGIPVIEGFEPGHHATRKGWIARANHFPANPFTRNPALRAHALAIANHFADSIRRLSDPFSERVLFSVLRGETPSLVDLDTRPPAYDDVGRTVRWGSVIPELGNFGAERRRSDVEALLPPWRGEGTDRRTRVTLPPPFQRRTSADRRAISPAMMPRLARSRYERVFRLLGTGKPLKIGRETLTPIAVKGWYHAVFRDAAGAERMLSIDQVLDALAFASH